MEAEKVIKLPLYNIVITLSKVDLEKPDRGISGTITSDLKELCGFCNNPKCDMLCVDAQEWMSDRDLDKRLIKKEEIYSKILFNNYIDIVGGIILAHACAGEDVGSPAYIEGIETVLDKIGNKSFKFPEIK